MAASRTVPATAGSNTSRLVRLDKRTTITLDDRGNGLAKLGPDRLCEVWYPELVSVSMTGPARGGCFVYAGPGISEETFTDSTWDVGNAASDLITGKRISPGEHVLGVWCAGRPGAAVTLRVEGTKAG